MKPERRLRRSIRSKSAAKARRPPLVAARRLLAENAHRLGDSITVEADVATELDWVPKKVRAEREG